MCSEKMYDKQQEPDWGPVALDATRKMVRQYQAEYATRRDRWIDRNSYFYYLVKRALRYIIEPQSRVLNLRCQTGFLLDAVEPSRGVGVEISSEMAGIAKQKYPKYDFVVADPEELSLTEKFDYILFGSVSDTVDLQRAFARLQPLCERQTRLVLYTHNPLWAPIFSLAERLGLKMPLPEQNWLSEHDLRNLLELAGFQWLRSYRVVLFPKNIPVVSWLLNRVFAKIPVLNRLCMITLLVARPKPVPLDRQKISVSVIVPCRNEAGNIEHAVKRIPQMGRHTEVLFCDDKSTDGTADEVRRMQREFPGMDIKLVAGPGICKAQNVWAGFRAASGDVLMILDADLAVMPEELPYFFNVITEGTGEFINGSRMVYPMQRQAMKFTNMIGNKFFGSFFSVILSQRIGDTLCGTKVLWRSDWRRYERLLGTWGIEDRWGDYELLFGASKLHMRIMDLPVHYQERIYGATKMVKVFQNGLRMLRMCAASFIKLKLGY